MILLKKKKLYELTHLDHIPKPIGKFLPPINSKYLSHVSQTSEMDRLTD